MEAAFPGCHPGSDQPRSAPPDDQPHRALLLARAYLARLRDLPLRHQDLNTGVHAGRFSRIQVQESNQDLAFHQVAGRRLPVPLARARLGNVRPLSARRNRGLLQVQAFLLLDAIRRRLPRPTGAAGTFSQADLRHSQNRRKIELAHLDCRIYFHPGRTRKAPLPHRAGLQAATPVLGRRHHLPE